MALMTQVGLEFIARDKSRAGMASFNRGLTTMTRSILQLAGIGGGMYMIRGQVKAIWDATLKQEAAEKALEAAVGKSITSYQKYAAELQKVTIYGDEEILNQMAYARNLGVTADKLNEAAKAAIGLAAKYRIDLSSAMMLVGRASMGQTQLLTRYGIVLDENLTAQEKFNELLKIGADAFHLAEAQAKTAEGTLTQLDNTWGDLQETIGQQFVPAVTDALGGVNKVLQDHDRAIKGYISDFREGVEVALEIQKIVRQISMPVWWQAYKGYKSVTKKPPPEEIKPIVDWTGATWKIPLVEKAAEKEIEAAKRTNAEILADTREKLTSIRAMDYMTRMEKIENLKAYTAAHAGELERVAEAEKLLSDEIIAIQFSRMDAMMIYQAELREDMQNTSLYISEKFAEASRSIERSMSSAFESMISEGASFRDAMRQFLTDIGNAFSRMAADMMARTVMESWVAPLMSGLAGGIGGLFSGGLGGSAAAPTYVPHHEGWIPDIIETYHSGRKIMPNEHLALLENDEWVVPDSKVSRGTGAAPSIVIYNESGQPIAQKGQPEFDGEGWVVSLIARNYTQGGSLKKLIR